MDKNEGTLLARKKQKVKFCDNETILFLRAYTAHPTSWTEIVTDVKENIERLPPATQQLYNTATTKQLRDRLSTKLSNLMAKKPEQIENIEIRALIQTITNMERRLVANPPQVPVPATGQVPAPDPQAEPVAGTAAAGLAADPEPGPAPVGRHRQNPAPGAERNHVGLRDRLAARVPSSDTDAEEPEAEQPRPRKRKQSLAQLVRENQLLYKKFMSKKVPKILRELGISSSDDE